MEQCFKRSLFELADVWTKDVTEGSYVSFLNAVFGSILKLSEAGKRYLEGVKNGVVPVVGARIMLNDCNSTAPVMGMVEKLMPEVVE
eukprot:SAG11_NODE_7637_length_1118_cov_0.810599_2_plen_87_part_00